VIALLRRSIAQARYVLIGSAVLLTGFQLIVVGQAAEIQRSQSFGRIAELLPAFLQRGLGSRAMLLATFKGTVAFGYFHPVVCLLLAVVAMYFTTEPAHEVEAGLVDLELARAVPRWWLLARSLLLSNLAAIAAVVLMALGTSLGGALFDTAGMDMPEFRLRVRLLVNLLAVASCFGAFALLVGASSQRWATAFTTGALTAIVAYLVDFLSIGWEPMRVLNWLSPFHYYPALSVIAGDAPTVRNVIILLTASAAFAAAAFWRFERRDL
jgi:ABC-type transport system involved in multi-copper enzyme maturation permease subunit